MQVDFLGEKCDVKLDKYTHNGTTAIVLICEDGTPMAFATLCVPEIPVHVDDGEVLIKDYSENEGMLETLIKAGIVVDVGITIPVGLIVVHLCHLTEEAKKLLPKNDSLKS